VVDDRRQLGNNQANCVKTLALGWLVQWLGHEFDNSVLKEAAALVGWKQLNCVHYSCTIRRICEPEIDTLSNVKWENTTMGCTVT